MLAAVPCRPDGTFLDGWDLSQPTLAEKWFLEERECIALYYVHPFYNIDCLELKLLLPTKFKTVPLGLCPEASLNYDEGKLTRELALCAIRCGDPKKDSDFIK